MILIDYIPDSVLAHLESDHTADNKLDDVIFKDETWLALAFDLVESVTQWLQFRSCSLSRSMYKQIALIFTLSVLLSVL